MIFHSESIIVLPLPTSFMKIRNVKNNFLKDLDNRVSHLRFSGLIIYGPIFVKFGR
jgi:hypothetical protein